MSPEQLLSRRTFVAGLAAAAGSALLAACGGSSSPTATTAATSATVAPTTAAAAPTTAAATVAPTKSAASAVSPAATTASSSAVAAAPTTAATSAAAPTTQAAAGTAGGTFTGGFDVGPGGSPQGFNPITQGAGFMWLEKYYSKLLVYDIKFTKMQGDLAESWDISPDAKTFTFHLRKGILWHDGQPFTSDDVKFSIEVAKSPDSANPYGPKYADIQDIATPDPLTCVITLGKPNAAFLDALIFVFMIPKHALGAIAPKDLVKNQWWFTNPVGTGPYKWTKYVQDQYVQLAPNENYWRGKPKLDQLINRYFKEAGSSLIALQKGEIQFTYLTSDEAEIAKKDANLTVLSGPSQVVNYLCFNLKDPRLQDVRVRQAFAYAIDRQAIVDQIFKGSAVVVPAAFDQQQYTPKDANPYKRDVNKAKQLLQAANWDKIKGSPIEILTYYADQVSTDVLTTAQQQLAEAGIAVTLRAVDVPTFNGFVSKAEPQFTIYYAGGANGPEPDVTSIYFLSTAVPPSGSNRGFWNNPDEDKAYLAGRADIDPAKRAADYQAAASIQNDQLPWVPMWVTTRFGAVSKKVQNFLYTPSAGSGRYYDQAELWTVSK
jgi:peptide/nickel transport system substrate-binding protein